MRTPVRQLSLPPPSLPHTHTHAHTFCLSPLPPSLPPHPFLPPPFPFLPPSETALPLPLPLAMALLRPSPTLTSPRVPSPFSASFGPVAPRRCNHGLGQGAKNKQEFSQGALLPMDSSSSAAWLAGYLGNTRCHSLLALRKCSTCDQKGEGYKKEKVKERD